MGYLFWSAQINGMQIDRPDMNSFKLLEYLEATFFEHISSTKADDQDSPHYVRNSCQFLLSV
jgi:hypothetical protein